MMRSVGRWRCRLPHRAGAGGLVDEGDGVEVVGDDDGETHSGLVEVHGADLAKELGNVSQAARAWALAGICFADGRINWSFVK